MGAVATYTATLAAEFHQIPAARRNLLQRAAGFVRARVTAGEPAQLTFICTHNSRRSQMAQVWAQTAAHDCGVPGLKAFSGGTEATCVAPPALAALQAAGLVINQTTYDGNPLYTVRYAKDQPPIKLWSKRFDDEINPQCGYLAVMTCSEADAQCPIVPGAAHRLALPYQDPKAADGTPGEPDAYRVCCRLIARELFYLFNNV